MINVSSITNMDSLRHSTSDSKQFYFCYSYIYYMITQFVYIYFYYLEKKQL